MANNIHILIVDDDDRIRTLLKDYLSSKNYIVSSAENAVDAKKKIEYLKYDISMKERMTLTSDLTPLPSQPDGP